MAGESIVFDFAGRGAGNLQRDFRQVGDNAALAAKGARLCADAIERQRKAAGASAGATLALAKADDILEEAEHGLRDGALEAEFALKRETEAAKKSGAAARKAAAENTGLAASLQKLADNAKKGGGPGLLGPALLLAPALTSLGGVAAGAGIGLAGAFTAGAGALAAFGAVAKPVLTGAKTAAAAVEKAQNNYNIAIAHGTKQSVAYKAEQVAIAKAYSELSPAQIALSKQLQAMGNAWQDVKAAQTPVVAGALQPWLKAVTDLTGNLGPIIAKIAPVIRGLGTQFDALVGSAAFRGFRDFVANTGSKVVGAVGGTLIDFVKAAMILLPKFNPLILKMTGGIAALGPAVLKWANSKKVSDDITKFMDWFSKNGPVVGGFLKNIGGALKALAPGLTSGGTLELQVMSGFFAFIAKLPPALAKPLIETAGVLLTLNKLGVFSVGVKFVGAAAKWLTGGLVNLGGGAAAGAEIRAAMVSGGAAAAAEIRAAMAGGGAAGAAGKGGAAGAAGAGLSFVSKAGLAAAGAAIAGGLLLEIRRDLVRGWQGLLHDLPGIFSGVGGILNVSATGWSNAILDHFSRPVRAMWHDLGHFLVSSFDVTRHQVAGAADSLWHQVTGSFDQTRHQASSIWGSIAGAVSGAWHAITGSSSSGSQAVSRAFGAAGAAADALRTRNLVPLLGQAGRVSGGIQGLAGLIRSGLAPALDMGGSHADAFRVRNLGPLQGALARTSGGVQGLQGLINAMHGKTVNVGVHASGGGGMTFTEKVAASISSGGFSLRSLAAGGMITQGTGPRADDVLIRASKGELIVPAHLVGSVKPVLGGKIPGFASGGIAGMIPWTSGAEAGFAQAVEADLLRREFAHLKATVHANAAGPSSGGGHTGWNPGAGVNQWRTVTLSALKQLGLWSGLVLDVLYQMMTESGGNPNAVNRTDSNWIAGHPSVGLMQVIRGTFAAYAGKYRNTGPFLYGVSTNPMANIYAALNYGAHNGRGFGTGPGQIGSGHGYALGTSSAAPGWAWVGEHGRELVRFRGGEQVAPVRPAQVIPAARGGQGRLQIEWTGGSGGDELLTWIRKNVRVKGAGDVQRAFGAR